MARLRFTIEARRRTSGAVAAGDTVTVYTDTAGTAAADVSATSGGSSLPGSQVTLDALGGAVFWGPPSRQDTLYLRFASDPSLGVQTVYADHDPRLDALEATLGAVTLGSDNTWTGLNYWTSGRPHVDVRAFSTVQAAINAAPTGSQINLGPGTLPSSFTPSPWTPESNMRVKGDGMGATVVTGTVGQDVITLPVGGTVVELEGFTIAGGARGIVSAGATFVTVQDVYVNAPSAECFDLSDQNEEWHLLRVLTQGGTYGFRVRNTGANPLLDKSTFVACQFAGASVNALSAFVTLCNTVLFAQCNFITSGQHNVALDGGIRQLEFLVCNTEGAGQGSTSNRTTLSGSVSSGATSGTLASSTGWAGSGSAVTIKGAGTSGADHQGGAWTRSGTTLTWATATATTVSGPNVTDARFDDYAVTNTVASPSEVVWRSTRCGFDGQGGHLRYAISIPATGLYRADNCSNDGNIPVYDPGSRMRVTGGQLTVRRPGTTTYAAGEDLYAPVVAPVITGSRGGNAALTSLLAALAARGFIVDSTS